MTTRKDKEETEADSGEQKPSTSKGRRAPGAAAKAPARGGRRKSRATSADAEPQAVADASGDAVSEAASATDAKPKSRPRSAGKAASKRATSGTRKRATTPRRKAAVQAEEQSTDQTAQAPGPQVRPLPRLHARLREEIAPQMIREFEYTTPMQAPRLSKIVVNIGLGEALENSRAIESATGHLALITGQQPVVRRARKSIAAFKLRQGQAIGLSVTLRGRRMYEFLDRLISSSLPRIRDFNGLSRDAFDGRGNYSIGLREQIIFPEIDYNAIDRIRGLQIAIVTTAPSDREGFRLLELLGMPFARTPSESVAA